MLKGQCAILVFKVHVILLESKKITQFIVDVTNACDKECLADVTKTLITGKTILTESELETAKLNMVIPTVQNISVYDNTCTYVM